MRCPICDKVFEPATSNALPFCGERCRTIDLGRWLGESYGMPFTPDAEALEQAPGSDEPGSGGTRDASQ